MGEPALGFLLHGDQLVFAREAATTKSERALRLAVE